MKEISKFILNDIIFFAHHGLTEEEKVLGQNFSINLEMECLLDKVFKSDLIDDTVDYSNIFNIVKDIVMFSNYYMIETIADKIIAELFLIPKVKSVHVEVRKLNPPIKDSEISYAAVSLYRSKDS